MAAIERNCPHCGKRMSDWVFPRPFITAAEAAFIMGGGVTEGTIEHWIDQGHFTRYQVGLAQNAPRRLDQDEVVAFIKRADFRKAKRADAEKSADPQCLTTREKRQNLYWVPPPLTLHHERFSTSKDNADLDKKSRLRRDARRLRGLWRNY